MATEDTWIHYTKTTTSSQYFKQNFKILLEANCRNWTKMCGLMM